MEFTGERLIPGQVNPDLWAEHISRYQYAAQFAHGRDVLDIGCGAGYGTALLADKSRTAMGIDLALDAIQYARAHYSKPHLCFTTASATALPFANATFDFITAFEVIEHLENWDLMLTEARRVLRPGGLFLVSTPNREYYTESRGTAGANPYHVHEFAYAEFRKELTKHFPSVNILLQNRVEAFAFYPPKESTPASTHLDTPIDEPTTAYFFLGFCTVPASQTPETKPPTFVYLAQASNLLREREHHIQALTGQLAEQKTQYQGLDQAHRTLEQDFAQRTEWAHQADRDLATAQTNLAELQRHLETQNQWAMKLDAELKTAAGHHEQLQRQFEERSQWAASLDQQLNEARAQHAHLLTLHDDLHRQLEERTRWAQSLDQQLAAYEQSRWMRLGRSMNLGPNRDK